MEDINISKDNVKISIVNRKQEPLDPRITRYLLRADIFQNVSLEILLYQLILNLYGF